MNCFQIVKTVLDEIYAEIPGVQDGIRDGHIRSALSYLRQKYAKLLTDDAPIDYANPVNRFAYVYSYVTCHANLVATRIAEARMLRRLFNQPKVNISCIGGGPGSDFLGILKFMMQASKEATVKCFLLDGEERWGESWVDVDNKVDPTFRISTHFQRMDVTDANSWNCTQKFVRQSDLFTLTYFMSEVHKQKSLAEPYFNNLIEQAKPGALFLYIDNNRPEFYDWFDHLVTQHGLEVLDTKSYVAQMPFDEEKRDLGIYYTKFGSPKLEADIAYRLCRKVEF